MSVGAPRVEALSQTIQDFAAAIAETPEFQAYEQANLVLRQDQEAQRQLEAMQVAQPRARWGLPAADDGEASLETLRRRTMAHPTVKAYVDAQESLSGLCQDVNALLGDAMGTDFAAAAAPSCCG